MTRPVQITLLQPVTHGCSTSQHAYCCYDFM